MNIENPEKINENIREIYLKKEFFELIESGLKTLELRVAFPSFLKITEGDHIMFKSGNEDSIEVEIIDIRKYGNIDDVMQKENILNLAPNMSDEQIQKISKRFFNESDIKKHGLLIFEFKKIE